MSIKFFKWQWLNSEEQREYKALKAEKQRKEENASTIWEKDIPLSEFIPLNKMPYKSIRCINNEMVICVLWDGTPLTHPTGGESLVEQIKVCDNELQIIPLFFAKKENVQNERTEKEEQEQVKNHLSIFENHPDFDVRGEKVFLKKVPNVPIPPLVVGSFIEILEKLDAAQLKMDVIDSKQLEEAYLSLLFFTYKLLLNPIESSRNDLIKFVRINNVKLTNSGNLVLYRRAVSVKTEKDGLVGFVSKEYFKIKKWKKSPKNYEVFNDNSYVLVKGDTQNHGYNNHVGNLEELYLDLPNMEENLLTDAHTRKMEIKVGSVYKIAEDEVDINSRDTCSSGLHCAARSYNYSGFGDTPLLVIVSPSKVRSVPIGEEGKMRVVEMFITAILEVDENGQYMDEDVDVVAFDEEYHNYSIDELTEAIKQHSFAPIASQDQVAPLTVANMEDIANMLKNRVKNI